LAKAQANASARLAAFLLHGDGDPGHAKAFGQALNRLEKAIEQVKKYCKCDNPKIIALIAGASALVVKIVQTLQQMCSMEPELCYAF